MVTAGLRPLDLSFFRAVDLAAVLLTTVLRVDDFFCAALRPAGRDAGFFLAIGVLPFLVAGKRYHISQFAGWAKRSEPTIGFE
jgi:hypothetical protein